MPCFFLFKKQFWCLHANRYDSFHSLCKPLSLGRKTSHLSSEIKKITFKSLNYPNLHKTFSNWKCSHELFAGRAWNTNKLHMMRERMRLWALDTNAWQVLCHCLLYSVLPQSFCCSPLWYLPQLLALNVYFSLSDSLCIPKEFILPCLFAHHSWPLYTSNLIIPLSSSYVFLLWYFPLSFSLCWSSSMVFFILISSFSFHQSPDNL